ncbi:hypothetical protein JOM56_004880 [Amanita muscaria]
MEHCGDYVGYRREQALTPGRVKLCKKTKTKLLEWSDTCWGRVQQTSPDMVVTNIALQVSHKHNKYYKGNSFVTSEGDICCEEQNVIVHQGGQLIIGQIKEILVTEPTSETASYVTVQLFHFLPEVHEILLVPCLELKGKFMVIAPL